MIIYCTGCLDDVDARLTDGAERYPHRLDLKDIPFWRCDGCGNYVGCHNKSSEPTKPLGCIATPEIVDARKRIHSLLDRLWKTNKIKRGQVYRYISDELGYSYHTGEIRSVYEAEKVYKIVSKLSSELKEKK